MFGSLLCPKAPMTPQIESRYLHRAHKARHSPGTKPLWPPAPSPLYPGCRTPTPMALGNWALPPPGPPACCPQCGAPRTVQQMLSLQALGGLDAPHPGAPQIKRQAQKGLGLSRALSMLGLCVQLSCFHCHHHTVLPRQHVTRVAPQWPARSCTRAPALHGTPGPVVWQASGAHPRGSPGPLPSPSSVFPAGSCPLSEPGKPTAGAAHVSGLGPPPASHPPLKWQQAPPR